LLIRAAFRLQTVFSIIPLNAEEWKWVIIISFPVLIIDEILKWVSRTFIRPRTVDGEHAHYEKKKEE